MRQSQTDRVRWTIMSSTLLCALQACGNSDLASRPDRDEAKPTELAIVANALPRDETQTEVSDWVVTEEWRIGGLSGTGAEEFSEIEAMVTDGDGTLFVLEDLAQEVRVFDSQGEYSHSFGGRGGGPGEFVNAGGLNTGPDGKIWVWDPGNRRFSAFLPSGEFIASHTRQIPELVYPWRGEFTPEGELVDWGLDRVETGIPNTEPTQTLLIPVNLGLDFAQYDTLPAVVFEQDNTADNRARLPFGRRALLYLDRSGYVWSAPTRDYEVFCRHVRSERPFLQFSLEARPARVTGQEMDSLRLIIDRVPPFVRPPMEAALQEMSRVKPAINSIFSDDEEYLYVIPQLDGIPVGAIIDVFGRDGTYYGEREIPYAAA